MMLPQMMTSVVNMKVSLDRLSKYLECEDLAGYIKPNTKVDAQNDAVIVLQNATFCAHESLELPQEVKDKVFTGNARRLLGLQGS